MRTRKNAGKILYDAVMAFGKQFHPFLLQMLKIDRDADSPFIGGRVVEYPFVISNLDLSTHGRILDVGCSDPYNCIPVTFINQGHEVFGIDGRDFKLKYSGFKFCKGDIRKTQFADKFFDRVISVSTIEHIGVTGRYCSDNDLSGDRKALLEMARILKPDGKILITVPYGCAGLLATWERVYDDKMLADLISGLKIEKVEYYKINNNGYLERVKEEVARLSKCTGKDAAVACLKLSFISPEGITCL